MLFTLAIACNFSLFAIGENYQIINGDILLASDDITPSRTVYSDEDGNLIISFEFPGFTKNEVELENTEYQLLKITGFGINSEIGSPALPTRLEKIALSGDTNPIVTVISSEFVELENISIAPMQPFPEEDLQTSENYEINSTIYNSNIYYPNDISSLQDVQIFRNIPIAYIRVNPVQFNPSEKRVRIYTRVKIKVDFNEKSTVIQKNTSNYSENPKPVLLNTIINSGSYNDNATLAKSFDKEERIGYLIVTTPEFRVAADTLASWKRQLGFDVEIISQQNWTTTQVKNTVQTAYNSWETPPSYLLLLGDQNDVPSEEKTYEDEIWYLSVYYTCMDGPGDKLPDMAQGRIPADNLTEAMVVVNKIIEYEKNPPSESGFYRNALHCAYFEENPEAEGVSYKRYTHTTEESREYMLGQGFDIKRVYTTEHDVNPQYYSGWFSGGGPVHEALLRSNGFAWDGDRNDIIDGVNEGALYLFHRDHGVIEGWRDPEIDNGDVALMENGNKLPVVFSINCHSGSFQLPNRKCFSEALLQKENGGAVGVIAATALTYSGYNDALIEGLLDAIWPDPGLVPKFGTSFEVVDDPELIPHEPIYTMGDIFLQGLFRMTETWNGWATERQYERFHYFGDPAMQLWTNVPVEINADHTNKVAGDAKVFKIFSTNCTDGIATLCFGNELINKIQLNGNSGEIVFSQPLSGTTGELTLTISKHNYKPYISKIPFVASPIADFNVSLSTPCPGDTISLIDKSLNVPDTWDWEIYPTSFSFVDSTTNSSKNPQVILSSPGNYQIQLVVTNALGIDTVIKKDYIIVADLPPLPTVNNEILCDQGSALLTASGATGNYRWWDSFDRQTLLSMNNSYHTPVLDSSTSYFVEAHPNYVSGELSTLYNYTNSMNGNMFNVTALNEILIDSISLNIHNYLEHTAEVYYKEGTFEGSENNPGDWTLVGAYSITGKGSDIPTSVDVDDIRLTAGATYGFYVTLTSGSFKDIYGANTYTGEDLIIDCGAGVVYPFSTVYAPRTWNGTIHYSKGQFECTSELKEVQVIVIPTPEAPEYQYHEVCYDNDTLVLQVTGENVNWYNDSLLTDLITSGNFYQPISLVVGINTYYVTKSNSPCSSTAGEITINLHEPVSLPVTDNESICFGDTAMLIASGNSIRWYQNDTLHAETDTLTIIGDHDGLKVYKVTNFNDGCESKPLFTELQVHPLTPTPKSMNRTACEKDTVILAAEGTEIYWYNYTDMSLLEENEDTLVIEAIEPGAHKFIVTNKVNGCESDTIRVEVLAKALPDFPTLVKTSFCEDEFISIEAIGEHLRWFTDETMKELIGDSIIYVAGYLEAGIYTYYLDETIEGCISELTQQDIVVNSLPDIYLGEDTIMFLGSEITFICNTLGNYVWQDNSTGNTFHFIANDFGVGTHKVEVTMTDDNKCLASDQLLVVVVDPLNIAPHYDENLVLIYPNPTSGLLTIEFNKALELPAVLSMYNASGQCVLKNEIEYMEKGDKLELNLTDIVKGLYRLAISNPEMEIQYQIVFE